MSGATLTISIGDNTHSAVTTNKNLDGSDAVGVITSYASDNPSVCAVDASTGALTPLAEGVANISEDSSRLTFSHTDIGVVTVTDANTGDFTSELTFV